MKEQVMKETIETVEISSKGKSKEEAIAKAFNALRETIYKKINKPIVHMNTKEVYLNEVDERKYTEKFLFLFIPREKSEFTIKLKIIVEIKYIEI